MNKGIYLLSIHKVNLHITKREEGTNIRVHRRDLKQALPSQSLIMFPFEIVLKKWIPGM